MGVEVIVEGGGEGGIRTLGTLKELNSFRDCPVRPLRHLSAQEASLITNSDRLGSAADSQTKAACQGLALRRPNITVESALPRLVRICTKRIRSYMENAEFYSEQAGRTIHAPLRALTRFSIGDVVRHRLYDFRGVIFDVDPVFANSEEWYEQIPEDMRPRKDQPFYHLLAENDDSSYVAYVSQQNLLMDDSGGPIDHPTVPQLFEQFRDGRYQMRRRLTH